MASLVLQQLGEYGPDRCRVMDLEEASAFAGDLVKRQYENFSVVSWLLPRHLRRDFAHVYAFCRWADDLGDEVGDPDRSLELLAWWRRELQACYAGAPRHPVFVALGDTVRRYGIPAQPFEDLITAFELDQRISRYASWSQVLDYCRLSADPVGRIVLYLCGHSDPQRQKYSDATCTALQLTNHWQDVRRDILERDRIYVPAESLDRVGLTHDHLVRHVRGEAPLAPDQMAAFRNVIRDLADRTWPLFAEGRRLWPLMAPDLRPCIELFTLGGEGILHRLRAIGYNSLERRPRISRFGKALLMLRTFVKKTFAPRAGAAA